MVDYIEQVLKTAPSILMVDGTGKESNRAGSNQTQVWGQIRATIRGLAIVSAILAVMGPPEALGKAKLARPVRTEVKVLLFGQPCFLSGPTDESTLRLIHSVSPEQIPASQTPDQVKVNLERLTRAAPNLPAALEGYRERLAKRLGAQREFFGQLDAARKAGSAEPLIQLAKKHVQVRQIPEFESLAKKFGTRENLTAKNPVLLNELIESYNEFIEPLPDEEFHRAINRMDVSYSCILEEGNEDEELEDAMDDLDEQAEFDTE